MCASRHGQHLLKTVRQAFKQISNTKGFDKISRNVEVLAVEPGRLKVQFKVEESHLNSYGTLHGGCTSYLTDMVSTVALLTTEPGKTGVSVDLSVAYMLSAKENEVITIDADVLKSGKQLAFCNVDFRNEAGKLLAQGKHTKFVGGSV